jgi:ubiquinol-cytochrome c reductase cytochrome c subunit
MRRGIGIVLLLASVALLLAGAVGRGQPPSGLSRPSSAGAKDEAQLGRELFAANCASCHGSDGRGVSGPPQDAAGDEQGLGPSLQGVGALAADFYLRTGYMPLGRPDEQPMRKRPRFSERELRALIAHVAALGPGPDVPDPHPEQGDIAAGQHLFTEHCAGCHQVVGQGGVVTGARVPPLQDATATQIAEAVRIGPYLMPRFSEHDISDAELDSIVRYVLSTRHPPDRGGWGIGNIGPIPEGMVTWLLAMVALVGVCVAIGRRAPS